MNGIRKSGFFRNFVFGVEDSLVSTVGLLSGVAAAGAGSRAIFTTGVILVFVEAFSMAVGSFLSENSAEEYEEKKEEPMSHSAPDAAVMFASYFFSGFIPLFPYLFFPVSEAFPLSVFSSLVALGILGFISAKMSRTGYWKGILKMVILGGAAILIGILVGNMLK